jgi:hypothetical protein
LPSALFIDYANRIRGLKAEFHHAADEFASEFPAYVARRQHPCENLR